MKRLEKPHSYRSILATGSWFNTVPAELQGWLFDNGEVCRFTAGTRLFARGSPSCGLYGVVEGVVRITGVSVTGKEALLTLIEPPHWFGEIALFDNLLRTHDAIAETAVTAVRIAQPTLESLLDVQPHYWRVFGRLLTHKLRLSLMALEETALLPAPVRLPRRLVMMAEGYGDWRDRSHRVISVQQELLAAMLSISRQTTNQILKDLEARGIIRLARGEIEIIDLDQLRAAGNMPA